MKLIKSGIACSLILKDKSVTLPTHFVKDYETKTKTKSLNFIKVNKH